MSAFRSFNSRTMTATCTSNSSGKEHSIVCCYVWFAVGMVNSAVPRACRCADAVRWHAHEQRSAVVSQAS
eukprot:6118392-Pleurochrysis_carterae.AAC.5